MHIKCMLWFESCLLSHKTSRYRCVFSIFMVAGIVPILPRVSAPANASVPSIPLDPLAQIHEPRAHDDMDGRDWSSPDLSGFTYVPSFGAVEYAYPLTDRVHAFTLAQGPLVITTALPTGRKFRFVDENMRRADADNFPWASGVGQRNAHPAPPV
jgi:hypothetical protein